MLRDERMIMYFCCTRLAPLRRSAPEDVPLMREVFADMLELFNVSLRDQLDELVDAYYNRHVAGMDTSFKLPDITPRKQKMISDEEQAMQICTNYIVYAQKMTDYPIDKVTEYVKAFLLGVFAQSRGELDARVRAALEDEELVKKLCGTK